MKKLEMEKAETHYRVQLDASRYDYLEVIVDENEQITIKFLDTRWRTPQETIDMLEEVVAMLKTLPSLK